VQPLKEMLRGLHAAVSRASCRWMLCNQDLLKQMRWFVARTGLEKMKAVVRARCNDGQSI